MVRDQPGSIRVDIRGNPTPDFKWKKGGVQLNITGRYSVLFNGTLLISKVESGDNGTYDVSGTKNFFSADVKGIVVKMRGEYYYSIINL